MWGMLAWMLALTGALVARARWLDHDLARRRAVFEEGGPLVLWAKAWPTGHPPLASYGDLVVSAPAVWWFEAGSDAGVALRDVAVLDVRSGTRRPYCWLNDLSGWALVDLTAAHGIQVTMALPDDQAAVLVDAVARMSPHGRDLGPRPVHRAPLAGKPPWWAWVAGLAAPVMVGGYVTVHSLTPGADGIAGPGSSAATSLTQEIVSAGVLAMGGALVGLAVLGVGMALVRALRVHRVRALGGLVAIAAARTRRRRPPLASGGRAT